MIDYIDFSYPIDPSAYVIEKGINPPSVVARSRISAGRHSNTSYLELFAHMGTHIDAPWHFIDQGRKIEDFSIEEFVFSRVLLLEAKAEPHQSIEVEDLKAEHYKLEEMDCLLIYSGFSDYRVKKPNTYIHATPGLSVETAKYLSTFDNLRCIGVDFISIENVENGRRTGFPVHHALLGRKAPMIILEDADLSKLRSQEITKVFLFPLRMLGIEASPVTAVAEITN